MREEGEKEEKGVKKMRRGKEGGEEERKRRTVERGMRNLNNILVIQE